MMWSIKKLMVLTIIVVSHSLATTALTPRTLSDEFNNTADHNSVIDWGPMPEEFNVTYSESGMNYTPGNLKGLNNMVHTFLDMVMLGNPPYGK